MISDESRFYVQRQRLPFVTKASTEQTSQLISNNQLYIKKMFWGCFTFEIPCLLLPVDSTLKSDGDIHYFMDSEGKGCNITSKQIPTW